jgi:hypothetical protein
MRKAIAVVSLTLTALAVSAGAAGAQTPTQDSVVGNGFASFFYEIDVRSGPSGENPTGQLVARNDSTDPNVFFGGPPTCLTVRDNVATMNIQDTLGVGFGIVTVQVTDAPVDHVDVTLGRQPDDCSLLTSPLVSSDVISGDFVVTNATPLPTSKDQCKNGGWKSYGVFKNQGDCVSFVATGGKNPPAGSRKP